MMIPRGQVGREMGNYCLIGIEFYFCEAVEFFRWMVVWLHNNMNVPNTNEGFPCGSAVKNTPANAGGREFDSWVWKIPWERKWQPTLVFSPGKSHGLRSLVGYSPWGHKEPGKKKLRSKVSP